MHKKHQKIINQLAHIKLQINDVTEKLGEILDDPVLEVCEDLDNAESFISSARKYFQIYAESEAEKVDENTQGS